VEPLLHELGDELDAALAIGCVGEEVRFADEQRGQGRRRACLNLPRGLDQLGLADRREEQHPRR